MAIGGEVVSPTFADQNSRNNNTNINSKSKINPSSAFNVFRCDRPGFFSKSSITPLSSDKKGIGPVTRRNTTCTIARSELTQQSDVPRSIDDINKAKQRLDASARDGDPWVLVTWDDQGRTTKLSNSCSTEFHQRVEQAFINDTSIPQFEFNAGLAIRGSGLPSVARTDDTFTVQSSRRASLLEQRPSRRELSPLIRTTKRSATALDDSPSLSPGSGDQQCNVIPAIVVAVGAEDAINTFYTTTFRAIQQQALKQILKAWIKELEPHKQKHHPYKGGRLPAYWPEHGAFKEPDHLKTEDRVPLAINIIRFVQRDPKWSYGGIDALETSTRNIKLQFDDEPPEKRGKRQKLLQQLYHIAREQGSWIKGEKDGEDLVSYYDPIEEMRVKRQPRAKRQKAARRMSQSSERSHTTVGESPDMGSDTQYSTDDATPVVSNPIGDFCPKFTAQFHPDRDMTLATNQHTTLQNEWNTSAYSQSLPYGVNGLPHPSNPFPSMPGYPPVTGNALSLIMRTGSFDISADASEPMHLQFSNQTQSPTHLEFPPVSHGISNMAAATIPMREVKMVSQATAVYPVWTEEQHWEYTPAEYASAQYQASNDPPGHSF